MDVGERAGNSNKLAQYVGGAVIAFFWLAALSVAAVISYEYVLPLVRSAPVKAVTIKHPFMRDGYYGAAQVGNPYGAFNVQYLHPAYLFFFPLNPDKRLALKNGIVSITADGFRGGGPDAKKPLAVFLGGSAAFGDSSSSDQTTITGYLNKLQTSFHFVNAGFRAGIRHRSYIAWRNRSSL